MVQTTSRSSQPVPAIVIGLDCITGVQTARLLARRNVPVIAIAKDPSHPCCRTNVCTQILAADTGSEDLLRALESLGPGLPNKAVLYPCTDMSVLLISRHRARLAAWYHMALPAAETVEMLMDKVKFYTYAQEVGLPIPATFFLWSRADVEAAAPKLTYPAILKPPMKTPLWEKNNKAKVYKVNSAEELLAQYDRCARWADMLMVQDWVEGADSNLFSCNCYFDANAEPLVTFVSQKVRQWPLNTGTSSLGVDCPNDTVVEETVRLFRMVHFHGLGYVEMKRDDRNGKYYLIEPNIGRPTGRSAIAEASGVELHYTKYCDLLGLPLPANRTQTYTGTKWIYLRRDLQAAFYLWRRGELTLVEWWQSLRGKKTYALLSWSDPGPFFFDLFHAFGVKVIGASFGTRKPQPEAGKPGVGKSVTPMAGKS